LTRYSSLRSFQAWKWKTLLEAREAWEKDPKNQKGGENNKDGKKRFEEPVIILNYVPCSLYTADLFDALMSYKKIWKRIGESVFFLLKMVVFEANLTQYCKIRPSTNFDPACPKWQPVGIGQQPTFPRWSPKVF
jgi:hypothetical protein